MYHLAKKEDSDVVICDMMDHYGDGQTQILNCTKFESVYKVTPSASNKIFRKSIIKDLKFLNGKWYEDFNFTTKVLLKKPKISVISEPYYNCNVRESSTMNNNNASKNLDMIDVIDDLILYAKNNGTYDKNVFSYLIFDHILITTINRVAIQKNKDRRYVIVTLRKYCHKNIKEYKKMSFYKTIPMQRKIIALLNYWGLHNVSKMLLLINSRIKGGLYGKVKCNNTSL